MPTLAFEADNRLYGDNPVGYGLTNCLLCISCVLLLFWFFRELTNSPILTGASTLLFALWNIGILPLYGTILTWLALSALLVGLVRHGKSIKSYLPAYFILLYASNEITGLQPLYQRMIDWLPGRTASVMTVFALISLAAYARYERLGANRLPAPPPGPLDPPATRNTIAEAPPRRAAVVWALVSVVALCLALASYEQAVMIPATLLGVALTMRFQRYQVRWLWQAPFWLALVGYLVLRHKLVPSAPSHYQLQQFRSGPGVLLSLSQYGLPVLGWVQPFLNSIDVGPLIFLTWGPWINIQFAVSNVTAFVYLRRKWVFALAGYALSFIAYLPMAWMKQFEHYHYWPMAMRSLFVTILIWIGLEQLLIAWSPRLAKAPPRPSPAPGSLLRP